MARPIRETPILTDIDAENFVMEMQKVEQLSEEKRKENRKELEKQVNEALKTIEICF